MISFPKVFLKVNEEIEVSQGFPWVFDNEIQFIKYEEKASEKIHKTSLTECTVEDGAIVEVYTNAGAFLGTGVINKKSKITVRLIGKEHASQIMLNPTEYYYKKVQDAYDLRKLYYDKKDSYRLIYGESDFIPGLIVERYFDIKKNVYLVVQFLSFNF